MKINEQKFFGAILNIELRTQNEKLLHFTFCILHSLFPEICVKNEKS